MVIKKFGLDTCSFNSLRQRQRHWHRPSDPYPSLFGPGCLYPVLSIEVRRRLAEGGAVPTRPACPTHLATHAQRSRRSAKPHRGYTYTPPCRKPRKLHIEGRSHASQRHHETMLTATCPAKADSLHPAIATVALHEIRRWCLRSWDLIDVEGRRLARNFTEGELSVRWLELSLRLPRGGVTVWGTGTAS